MLKRINKICAVMCFTVMMLMPAVSYASSFTDVTGSEYYAEAAEALAEKNILQGYENGKFEAGNPITRAEMAAVMCRMLGLEAEAQSNKGKTPFDDVLNSHWASGYINTAAKEGIINGYDDGSFMPGNNVKYEEAVKMAVCALGYENDVQSGLSPWYAGYIDVADSLGITNTLRGRTGQASTRGDIAVLINNSLEFETLHAMTLSYAEAKNILYDYIREMLGSEVADVDMEGSDEPVMYNDRYTYQFECYSKSMRDDGEVGLLGVFYISNDGTIFQ